MGDIYDSNENITLQDAIEEASRCLNCKVPQCMEGCPAKINIPGYLNELKSMNIIEAYKIIIKNNVLPSITSRVCYKCNQCEGKCVLGAKGKPMQIGKLEQYISEYVKERELIKEINIVKDFRKIDVAIIGAGIAGLSSAIYLAKEGCNVTIYEKESDIGGVVRYEIPARRFDKTILDDVKKEVEDLRIDIIYNTTIGKDIKLIDIKKQNDYVILATGVGKSHIIKLDGEMEVIKNPLNDEKNMFMYASKYLRNANFESNYKLSGKTVIIGGGNTALDCARNVINSENETYIYYRRTEEKMPSRIDELEATKALGVQFKFLITPKKVRIEDGKLIVTFVKTKIDKDEKFNEIVIEIENSNFEEEIDHLIIASGYEANHDVYSKELIDLKVDKNNNIEVTDKLMVYNNTNMYAVGDLVTGSLTVVNAVKMGMEVGRNIIDDLKND